MGNEIVGRAFRGPYLIHGICVPGGRREKVIGKTWLGFNLEPVCGRKKY